MSCEKRYNVSAKEVTSFKGGGNIECVVYPSNLSDLIRIYPTADYILGCGSNMIIADEGVSGTALSTQKLTDISYDDNYVTFGAGIKVSTLLAFAARHGMGGFEFLAGIPASVGGLVCMNAGAFGREISDVLKDCVVVNDNGVKKYKPDSDYRGSDINGAVAQATFVYQKSEPSKIKDRIFENLKTRRLKQPSYPSCGSVFKNPEGDYAGRLIEACGFKGEICGGAMVSDKHANFIVNFSDAKASDFLFLVDKIKKTVYYRYRITLEEEFRLLDENHGRLSHSHGIQRL